MILKPDKKSKDYTSATIGVPVTLGHRACVPKALCPGVPQRMGWLWTARNVPAHRFDPAWRPGCVMKGIFEYRAIRLKKSKKSRKGKTSKVSSKASAKASSKSSSLVSEPESKPKKAQKKASQKSILAKKKSKANVVESSDDSESGDDGLKPMFYLQKKEGGLRMTLQQLKNPRSRTKSELPYDENIPPFIINVTADETVPPNAYELKKKRKMKRKKIQRRILFEQAVDSICKQLYENIDKEKIHEEAIMSNRCPCSCIQEYVLKYLSKVYGSMKEDKQAKSNNILETIIYEECILRTTPASPEKPSSEDEWTVEFTPPCAKFDPNYENVEKKDAEIQTKPYDGQVGLMSKSAIELKVLLT